MSQGTSALPAGWSAILDAMQARLDQAITRANARISELPEGETVSSGATHRQEIEHWSERLGRLSSYLESAEKLVKSVDESLDHEIARLRDVQSACESHRQTLATQTGRAIG